MAETTNHLRDLLEKIKGDAQRALALLPSEAELRSLPNCYRFWVAREYRFTQHLPGKQLFAPLAQLAEQATLNNGPSLGN